MVISNIEMKLYKSFKNLLIYLLNMYHIHQFQIQKDIFLEYKSRKSILKN